MSENDTPVTPEPAPQAGAPAPAPRPSFGSELIEHSQDLADIHTMVITPSETKDR